MTASEGYPKRPSPVFRWRRSICESALPATARHTALTLSLYMNESGGSAFPGGARLRDETGLSLRTVRTALATLEETGWLIVVRRGSSLPGKVRIATEYRAGFPLTGAGVPPVQEIHRCNSRHRSAAGDDTDRCSSCSPTSHESVNEEKRARSCLHCRLRPRVEALPPQG